MNTALPAEEVKAIETPRTNDFCNEVRRRGIDWHHSATCVAEFARKLERELEATRSVSLKALESCDKLNELAVKDQEKIAALSRARSVTHKTPFKMNKTPIETEVMYRVYARQKGSEVWIPQESSTSPEDVIYWANRNSKRNAEEFAPGAGREFVAVKATTTFELL